MRIETFRQRVEGGRSVSLVYKTSGDLEGLVSVWLHEGEVVLTWEECPAGEQYDESVYTRDERHTFETWNR